MFIKLTNEAMHYPWGSTTAIAAFRGADASGLPEAELWLGTHPGSPTTTLETRPSLEVSFPTLEDWLRECPALAAIPDGAPPRLPVLLKLLAASTPLSLQVHPSSEQARRGFAAEQAAGLPPDDPARNYKDHNPKPEIIVALSERFEALCGFRPPHELGILLELLRPLTAPDAPLASGAPLADALSTGSGTQSAMSWLLSGDPSVGRFVSQLVTWAETNLPTQPMLSEALATVRLLASHHPKDLGIAVSVLMNRVSLKRGECLFADAGTLHAYLEGFGLELMTASDNVVRGGLTTKHVDRGELMELLRFAGGEPVIVPAVHPQSRVTVWSPPAPFSLMAIEPDANGQAAGIAGPAIVIAEDDRVEVGDGSVVMALERGEAAFASAEATDIKASGKGRLWIATWKHSEETSPMWEAPQSTRSTSTQSLAEFPGLGADSRLGASP